MVDRTVKKSLKKKKANSNEFYKFRLVSQYPNN
jgi:hypothetical protein